MAEERINIEQIQREVRERNAGWRAGVTSVSQLPREQRLRRLGANPPPGVPSIEEIERRVRERRESRTAEAGGIRAPATFDLRNVNGSNFITPIQDQGNCGSCVSFGTIAAIEGTTRFQRNDSNFAIDLSEAHLFYCHGRSRGATCDTGWWPQEALELCQNPGVVDDACYPYTAGDQDCTGLCGDWQNRLTKITGHTSLASDTTGMKEWISTKGALTACFIVYDDFFTYQGGVYRHVSGAQAGGHCVSLVGYDDGQGCWIAKNSWGPGWGEGGFFRIAYGECGIDSWDVRGVSGVAVTEGWQNNKVILGLWAINEDRNAWVYLDGLGWRKVAPDNDNIFFNLLVQLVAAKTANRPVNVYIEQDIIKQVYVF